jgi:ubiquinone/menaquinone biosynthesis C-methylase UbiE
MPTMSKVESVFCRSAPWRFVAGRAILPWALQGRTPTGHVLEIGGGSGAMAAQLMARYPDIRMTVTDFDTAMVDAARTRLAPFSDRVVAQRADATALPFEPGSFDTVLSFIMLHHVIEWERALTEAVRVLRPGGYLLGYDLLATGPARLIHRLDGSRNRLMRLAELQAVLGHQRVDDVAVRPGFGRQVVRFSALKGASGSTDRR